MRRFLFDLKISSVVVTILLLFITIPSASLSGPLVGTVDSQVHDRNMPRIGMNLGGWTSWGASQVSSNVIKNPGFEGVIDRTLIIVDHPLEKSFLDDSTWTGRPDGFWNGARFDVRTGRHAGKVGRVIESKLKGRYSRPEFITDIRLPELQAGDVIALTRKDDASLPSHWWFAKDLSEGEVIVSEDVHAGSSGKRSVVLTSMNGKSAMVSSYLDTIGNRAGKLIKFNGKWELSYWHKAARPGSQLAVVLRRHGSPPFHRSSGKVPNRWQQVKVELSPDDSGPIGTVELQFSVPSGKGRVMLDEISLRPNSQPPASAFRDEVVSALKQLKPGFLRDWQGLLGDSYNNRMVEPFSRRTARYRPGLADTFGYSWPEFLDLAREVNAIPWLVLPTTFGDSEYRELGHYLSGRIKQDGFKEIVVEFGNENWNQIFRPAGIMNPTHHAQAADRAFGFLSRGAGADAPLVKLVNGQHANPNSAVDVLKRTMNANGLAVAPYFLHNLNRLSPNESVWWKLFEGDRGAMKQIVESSRSIAKEAAAYEVNLHTIQGNADQTLRQRVTAGAASGSALANRLMQIMKLGVRRQCIYQFTQFDTFSSDHKSLIKLWGVVRDLGVTGRFRPTGLATMMLNQVLPGDLHRVTVSNDEMNALNIIAIRSDTGWSIAAVLANDKPTEVVLNFPQDTSIPLPSRLLRLNLSDPGATNEDSTTVDIQNEKLHVSEREVRFTMQPWGFVVLKP